MPPRVSYGLGQLEIVETETRNGKWEWKTETVKCDQICEMGSSAHIQFYKRGGL